MPLEPGQTATVERIVTRELTADVLEKIAAGRHERFVVPDLAKFLERTMNKAKGRG